jgi:hypothetical protein
MSRRIKNTVALLFLIASTLLFVSSRIITSTSSEPQTLRPAPPKRFGVSGFLVIGQTRTGEASLAASSSGLKSAIYVPGVEVELRELTSNTTVAKVRTDLSGRFRFAPQLRSRYQVCWQARGIVAACNKVFSIQNKHIYLGPLPLAVDSSNNKRTFFGKVRFADGSLPRTLEPMVGVNAFATVQAQTTNGTLLAEAYVNNYGDYIIPGLGAESRYRLSGNIEAANVTQTVFLPNSQAQRVDLTFARQNAPEIRGLVRADSNSKRWTASPGDSIKITARSTDRDSNSLQYRWILPDGKVMSNPSNNDTIEYRVPSRGGLYEFTAIVSDGRGGYDKEVITLSTEGVRFGGTVGATDAPSVSGAQVEVNGRTTQSDASGRFALFVPESPRYVMNIRKEGYGLVSKIYDSGVTGGRWFLTRASVETVNPKQPIDVVNKRRSDDCPGALSDRWRERRNPTFTAVSSASVRARQPSGSTGRRSSSRRARTEATQGAQTTGRQNPQTTSQQRQQPAATNRRCGPGIGVRIPADSLVDENGQAPNGNVNIELTTVDLRAPDGMPGDYTARTQNGATRVMETFGAGTVEIRGGGREYNLRPGATADVTIPIDPSRSGFPGGIPNTIPLLSYNEREGVWVEEGQLQRVGNAYVGKVKHFSAINADTLKVNQSCIRLETVLLPPQFNIEMTTPQTNGPPKVQTQLIDNSNQRFHVAINLPSNVNVQFRVFELNNANPLQLIDVNALNVPTTQVTVNSGGPQNPTTPNQPAFPYDACRASAELTPFRPIGDAIDEFLHGLFSFQAANLTELDASGNSGVADQFEAAGIAYYNAIDPHEERDTLAKFKTRNGFPAADEVTLQYANSGDLGFGRDMHCRKLSNFGATGEYACYVTNYGNRFTNDEQDYLDALGNVQPIATVGMEFSRVEDPNNVNTLVGNPIVKFYVYKEANANQRAASANLDGTGERPVPQLCMVCHGGRYPNTLNVNAGVPAWTDAASADLQARFIPFDVVSLFMLNENGVTNQTKLRQLNCDIVRNAAPSPELLEVIEGMYGAACTGNQQVGFAVPGWDDPVASTPNLPNKEEVYANVVTPSCRACHVSQTPSDITWATSTAFDQSGGFISSLICNQHVMPHALVTHNIFWLSTNPHQPLLTHNFLNGAAPPGQAGTTGIDCVQE